MKKNNLNKIFDFLEIADLLKETERYSATKKMLEKESSADHSWKVALMTFLLAEELNLKIDLVKAMKIALVHDLAESLTGDIDCKLIARGEITKEEKSRNELVAIKEIAKKLPDSAGKQILDLWQDYENGSSGEAKYVKAVDKIEAISYLIHRGHKVFDVLDLIAHYADKSVSNFEELDTTLSILKKRLKKEYEKGGFAWDRKYDLLIN